MPSNVVGGSEDEYYSPPESDEDYTENEKILLNKVRNKKTDYSDSEDEVLAVRSADEDSDSDNKSDLAVSDIEGQEDDDLPDIRAWGKDKRKYYQTDYVDPDYGGFQGKDAQLAEFEEEEARLLQKQLAEQLDDDDFALDIFAKKPAEEEKVTEEIVKTDISKLSRRQKIQILEKDSPELFNLIDDYKSKMTLARDYLCPILEKSKSGQLSKGKAVDFVQTQYGIILNYCMNIYVYLYLKSTKTNVHNHPVIKRLFQYRQLLLQLEPVFEEIIKPQIELILEEDATADKTAELVEKKKKTLKLLASLSVTKDGGKSKKKKKKHSSISDDEEQQPATKKKKVKFADEDNEVADKKKMVSKESSDASSDSEEEQNGEDRGEEAPAKNELSKRAITYQMAKNKGLTPHRKKEQRNPRVKHRMKYRKAVIRRKGAVREPRKETSRYGGEHSGIKANVSRSVKIKS